MAGDKQRVTVEIDADLVKQVDALAAKSDRDRDHVIDTMLRCALERQARRGRKERATCWDPDRMIFHAQELQGAARKIAADEHDPAHVQPILLALAAEIALKAWQCRERGSAAHTHDLVKLFEELHKDTQARLQARMPPHPWPYGEEHARLSGNPFGGGLLVVLEFHRNTFEKWRYYYEHWALYTWPPQLDEALTAIIETYELPPRVCIPLGSMGRAQRGKELTRIVRTVPSV